MIVDAVVPFHVKDRDLLTWCLAGIRSHLDVARILVVCNRDSKLDVERVGGTFVDEDSIVEGLTARTITHERWGWYFQQILKLGMADRVDTQYYLVVDADTVFLRDVSFFNDRGKPLYSIAAEYHEAYFAIFRQILGFYAHREFSFTVHHMVYNRSIVKEMRNRFGPAAPWYRNITRYVKPLPPWNSISQFNEQETYGHYIKMFYPDEVNIRPLKADNIAAIPNEQMLRRLAKIYDVCSFHAWSREGK